MDNVGSWNNWADPWNSGLKLHAAGYLQNSNGMLYYRGVYGFYFSGTQSSTDNGLVFSFDSGSSNMMGYASKAGGFSVRCLRDN